MELRDLLRPEHILAPLDANTLPEAVIALLRRLQDAGEVSDVPALATLLTERPLRDIVAVGEHVVLPHFRTDAVDRLVVALGIAERPLAARETGLETSPRIVVLILAPPEAASGYLQTVSTLARLLRQDRAVNRLLKARSPADVLRLAELRDLRIQPRLAVRDIMTHRVHRVAPDASVREIVDLMVRRRVHAIPVVGDKGEVLGIVTDRDIMRALLPKIPRAGEEPEAEEMAPPVEAKVRDIMTRSVLCISEDMGLQEVANMMINKDVEQLPVVNEGALTGVLTRGDIIRKLFGR